MDFKNRDVISVKDFSKKEINDILSYAKKMVPYAKGEKHTDILKEKILSSNQAPVPALVSRVPCIDLGEA